MVWPLTGIAEQDSYVLRFEHSEVSNYLPRDVEVRVFALVHTGDSPTVCLVCNLAATLTQIIQSWQ